MPSNEEPRAIIARFLSNAMSPSLTSLRRAEQILRALEHQGYRFAPREPYIPDTEEDANELMDNGRNTGGGKMRQWR